GFSRSTTYSGQLDYSDRDCFVASPWPMTMLVASLRTNRRIVDHRAAGLPSHYHPCALVPFSLSLPAHAFLFLVVLFWSGCLCPEHLHFHVDLDHDHPFSKSLESPLCCFFHPPLRPRSFFSFSSCSRFALSCCSILAF